jgi:hypothetical protein
MAKTGGKENTGKSVDGLERTLLTTHLRGKTREFLPELQVTAFFHAVRCISENNVLY